MTDASRRSHLAKTTSSKKRPSSPQGLPTRRDRCAFPLLFESPIVSQRNPVPKFFENFQADPFDVLQIVKGLKIPILGAIIDD